jgi:hypothetical protein
VILISECVLILPNYVCMLKAMQSLLQEELEISKERIKIEEFTGY